MTTLNDISCKINCKKIKSVKKTYITIDCDDYQILKNMNNLYDQLHDINNEPDIFNIVTNIFIKEYRKTLLCFKKKIDCYIDSKHKITPYEKIYLECSKHKPISCEKTYVDCSKHKSYKKNTFRIRTN